MNKLARLQDKGTKDAGCLGTHSKGVAPGTMKTCVGRVLTLGECSSQKKSEDKAWARRGPVSILIFPVISRIGQGLVQHPDLASQVRPYVPFASDPP